jgi:selenocysteine-specific elongation factor
MPREELRSRLALSQTEFDSLVAHLTGEGHVQDFGGAIGLPGHRPAPDAAQLARVEALMSELRANPYAPAVADQPGEPLLAYLEDEGSIVRTGDGVIFTTEAYREMSDRIVEHLRMNGTITLAGVRDMFGTSRKYAQSLLEYLDAHHITRRVGDERVLRTR